MWQGYRSIKSRHTDHEGINDGMSALFTSFCQVRSQSAVKDRNTQNKDIHATLDMLSKTLELEAASRPKSPWSRYVWGPAVVGGIMIVLVSLAAITYAIVDEAQWSRVQKWPSHQPVPDHVKRCTEHVTRDMCRADIKRGLYPLIVSLSARQECATHAYGVCSAISPKYEESGHRIRKLLECFDKADCACYNTFTASRRTPYGPRCYDQKCTPCIESFVIDSYGKDENRRIYHSLAANGTQKNTEIVGRTVVEDDRMASCNVPYFQRHMKECLHSRLNTCGYFDSWRSWKDVQQCIEAAYAGTAWDPPHHLPDRVVARTTKDITLSRRVDSNTEIVGGAVVENDRMYTCSGFYARHPKKCLRSRLKTCGYFDSWRSWKDVQQCIEVAYADTPWDPPKHLPQRVVARTTNDITLSRRMDSHVIHHGAATESCIRNSTWTCQTFNATTDKGLTAKKGCIFEQVKFCVSHLDLEYIVVDKTGVTGNDTMHNGTVYGNSTAAANITAAAGSTTDRAGVASVVRKLRQNSPRYVNTTLGDNAALGKNTTIVNGTSTQNLKVDPTGGAFSIDIWLSTGVISSALQLYLRPGEPRFQVTIRY